MKVNWIVTNRCNLKCNGCIKFQDETPDSKEDLERIANRLIQLDVEEVTITGGEPGLVDIESSLNILKSKGVYIDYHTNGLNLDSKLNTLSHLINEIALPYDSSTIETQLIMRGDEFRKFYEDTFAMAKKIKQHGIKLTFHTVFSELNASDIMSIYKKLQTVTFDLWKVYEYNTFIVENRFFKNPIYSYMFEDDVFGGVNSLFAQMLQWEDKIKDKRVKFVGKLDGQEYFFVNNLGKTTYFHTDMCREKEIGNILDGLDLKTINTQEFIDQDFTSENQRDIQPFFMKLFDGNYFEEELETYRNLRKIYKFSRLYAKHLGYDSD